MGSTFLEEAQRQERGTSRFQKRALTTKGLAPRCRIQFISARASIHNASPLFLLHVRKHYLKSYQCPQFALSRLTENFSSFLLYLVETWPLAAALHAFLSPLNVNKPTSRPFTMTSPQDSTPASSDSPLPPGFKTIEQIQRSPNGDISAGVKVSVMGFLQDFREPIQTRGNGRASGPILKSLNNICRLQVHTHFKG